MKVILTESQYKFLLEFQKRAYSFDWDDNILTMPTKIHLEKNVNGEWVVKDVSTEEFREVRHLLGKEYRLLNNNPLDAFKDFREYQSFIDDTKKAILSNKFSPSFNKFKETLIYGNDFSIITARANPPAAIKEGIKILIDMTFSDDEKNIMLDNLKGLTIDQYLNLQDYHPISSKEFMDKFNISSEASNPEVSKTIAFKQFVDRVVAATKKLISTGEFSGLSVGFSDDDLGNVKKVEEFIKQELIKLYPDVRFLVYDTSDPKNPKKKRIIIEK